MPLRAFFRTKLRPKTVEEARNVYSFFASKGELIEFKFARDPDVKKTKDYGWISYKDSKITEQLFENWFKIEPFNTEVIVERSDKGEKVKENKSSTNSPLPPMFGGFYLKDDEASSLSVLDQTSNNFIPTGNNGREGMAIEVIEETIEASENQKEPSLIETTNFTENIIENTTIETKIHGTESQY